MNTGDRLHTAREIRDMTMKEIGIEMHYPISSAAVRIAQYESGLRQPKAETLDQLAGILNVSRKALSGPEGYEVDDVMRFLFELEEEGYDVTIRPEDGKMLVTISSEKLNEPLLLWNEIRTRYHGKEISRKEYITWKFCYEVETKD